MSRDPATIVPMTGDINKQEGFDVWDIVAIATTLAGLFSIVVMANPYRDDPTAILLAGATLAAALVAAKFNRGAWTTWFARAGAITATIAFVILLIGELTRNQ